jgi:hypothetical protein
VYQLAGSELSISHQIKARRIGSYMLENVLRVVEESGVGRDGGVEEGWPGPRKGWCCWTLLTSELRAVAVGEGTSGMRGLLRKQRSVRMVRMVGEEQR